MFKSPLREASSAGYQGKPGAYSDQIIDKLEARKHLRENIDRAYFDEFRDLVHGLLDGNVSLGAYPFENSEAGVVGKNHDLLFKYRDSLDILLLMSLPVRHYLLGQEGATIDDVKVAYSHEQALKQCSRFLGEKGIDPVDKGDTAGSAEIISKAEYRDRSWIAAIAGENCADFYSLSKIWPTPIQNDPNNTTHFYLIALKDEFEPLHDEDASETFVVDVSTENWGKYEKRYLDLSREATMDNLMRYLRKWGMEDSSLDIKDIEDTDQRAVFVHLPPGMSIDDDQLNEMELGGFSPNKLGKFGHEDYRKSTN